MYNILESNWKMKLTKFAILLEALFLQLKLRLVDSLLSMKYFPFTGPKAPHSRQSVNGDRCILPFKFDGKAYLDCAPFTVIFSLFSHHI